MKLIFFASAASASFLNLNYHGAGMVVHLLLLKSSMCKALDAFINEKAQNYLFFDRVVFEGA